MEKESFEDEEVARVLNDNFISIKVDREERPDIDNIYMNVCQMLTGSGGWPLTVFLTPDKKPFYAGTYFPKENAYGRIGIIDLLESVIDAWKQDKKRILNSGEKFVNELNKYLTAEGIESIDEQYILNAKKDLNSAFDSTYGGFGYEPKFPTPHNLSFLLKCYNAFNDKKALEIVEKTLTAMYKGGIFDHIGYGFCRYSTDRKWLVPHFEKMLYDNALLAYVYVEAYEVTKNELYKEVAEKIFEYVLRDMTSEEGGFYSSEDADSEGEEGKFYLWTTKEIEDILGKEDGKFYCELYDIRSKGNFQGKNIPNIIGKDINNLNNKELKDKLTSIVQKLFEARERRVHPFKDDKILTSWNSLMIAALAYGGRVFNNSSYIEKAENCYNFMKNKLIRNDGRLLARYRQGDAAYPAYLEDYAYLVWGLLELYEATFKTEYLNASIKFNEEMLNIFLDEENGGLFIYGNDSEKLIVKPKDVYDGAMPSGNSVAANNMLFIYQITEDEKLIKAVEKVFKCFSNKIKDNTSAHTHLISAYLKNIISSLNIVIAGNYEEKNSQEMIKLAYDRYNPFKTVVLNNSEDELYEICPSVKNKGKKDNMVTAYVCSNFTCKEPVTEISKLKEILKP